MANMTLTKTPMPEQDPKVRARNFGADSLRLNCNIPSAFSTSTPLMASAIKRVFLGEVGLFISFATYCVFFASLVLYLV